jgi:transcriptional regulator with XRE-family HTH domain
MKGRLTPLRLRRLEVGRSQQELSVKTGVSATRLSLAERGLARLTWADAHRLGAALNLDPTHLVDSVAESRRAVTGGAEQKPGSRTAPPMAARPTQAGGDGESGGAA